MTLKPGVRITGIKPETLVALMVCNDVYKSLGYEMVVTAVCDGVHSRGSIHYVGMAFDLRTSNLRAESIPLIVKAIKDQIGMDFDVLDEKDHVHVEFQPKEAL
jgi:hypothetical protein